MDAFKQAHTKLEGLLEGGFISNEEFDRRKEKLVGDYLTPAGGRRNRRSGRGRGACHNCGEYGHQAKACPYPEACHNCGGTDHKVNQCTTPATCHNCGSVEHRARDCSQPKPQRGKPEAERPKKGGDLPAEPRPKVTDSDKLPKRRTRNIGNMRCHNCSNLGHKAVDCKEPEMCHNCKKIDHKAADCPEPQTCHTCGSPEHKAKQCPDRDAERARQHVQQ
eukprot:TRINITY_DN96794_c0_g1_i1.p2 TRINITY_DN96794_c0_g1~~TRINITY_DN96794_c0_g1_i1.p2  ORF type:complete len:220 (-),score=11.66 TRINITY_DN96794_c0_g1_i1:277-936(-)